MAFQPDDGNVRLDNDIQRSTSVFDFMSMTTGDFDGDGLDDVAICMNPSGGTRTIELFLAPFVTRSSFSVQKKLSIRYSITRDEYGLNLGPSLVMADLNHDGKADLLIGRQDHDSGIAQVDIVRGRENPMGLIDLDQTVPDGRIFGVSQVAAGDFNGDGTPDLALCTPPSSMGYLALGGADLFSGVIDAALAHSFHRIQLGGAYTSVFMGDFNGDKKMDFAFSPPGITSDDLGSEVDIVFGRDSLPVPPSPSGIPVDVRILGTNNLRVMAVGDVTGDGRSDLFLLQQGGAQNGTLWALDGVDLSSGTPVLVQAAGQPNSVTFHFVGIGSFNSIVTMVSGDFDNDGADDFFPILQNNVTSGFLTSQKNPGGLSLSDVGSPVLEWGGSYGQMMGMGDLNGDGFRDLVVYEDFHSIYPPYGALRVLYGFRPLTRPSIRILPTEGRSPRVSLALAVDGSPAEMFLSGHFTNDFKEKWISYRPEQEVLLTHEEGTKIVTVQFRNAVGRVSDIVQTSTDLTVGPASVVTGTNRLRPGGTVVFDCHVLTPGTLRARVFGPEGSEVCVLEDRAVDPGVYSLFWEGRNGAGALVGRGVYYMVIEANGGRTKKEILVE